MAETYFSPHLWNRECKVRKEKKVSAIEIMAETLFLRKFWFLKTFHDFIDPRSTVPPFHTYIFLQTFPDFMDPRSTVHPLYIYGCTQLIN